MKGLLRARRWGRSALASAGAPAGAVVTVGRMVTNHHVQTGASFNPACGRS